VLFYDPSRGEALAIVWLKVVTFAVPQSGQNWFVRDYLPAAQSKSETSLRGEGFKPSEKVTKWRFPEILAHAL